jgi:hypothetical protein
MNSNYTNGHWAVGTPHDICINRTLVQDCDTYTIGDWTIQSPELIPCCLGALIIGLTLSKKVRTMNTRSHIFYAATFALVGIMMTIAGLNDSLMAHVGNPDGHLRLFLMIADVQLTSFIGYMFFLDAMLDAGILNENKPYVYLYAVLGFFGILHGWIQCFFHGWKMGFLIMYMIVVLFGCGSWVIVQMVIVIVNKDWKSLKYLFYCAFAGGFGFFSLLNMKLTVFLCEKMGCYITTEFIWFLVTDIAIYYIYKYYVARNEHTLIKLGLKADEENTDAVIKLIEMGMATDE